MLPSFASRLVRSLDGCIVRSAMIAASLLATGNADASILRISEKDLIATPAEVVVDPSAATNTQVIQRVLDASQPGDVVIIPAGSYLVKTLTVQRKKKLSLQGVGSGKTVLRRHAERWDNDTQGLFPGLAILHAVEVVDFELSGISFDGNAEHMAVKGPGRFGEDRRIHSGTPQFPQCQPESGQSHTVSIERSADVAIHHAEFHDGYRWCVYLGQVKNLHFHHNRINTGRLSTTWLGHADSPGGLMHCHQSQDGLHLVNCVDATIQWNSIRSEDSGLSIEANPGWSWFTMPGETSPNLGSRNIRVLNNDISTNSSAHQGNIVRGNGLAQEWVGQGCVDIFYHENWDPAGKIDARGERALLRDITIAENRLTQARHAVRAGIFRNANAFNATSPQHRIQGLTIRRHHSRSRAGYDHRAVSGISQITKDTIHPLKSARHGGVALLIHHADRVLIDENQIQEVYGGTGIEVVGCTQFVIRRNRISQIRGTNLADEDHWQGGEGIRVWNAPAQPCFDAQGFSIVENRIADTSSYAIFVTDTANGRCSRVSNLTEQFQAWPGQETRGIYLRNGTNVRE